MPYPGVPPSKTKDMESCVKQVMAQGKSKSSAIAICHSSIVGKSLDIKNLIKIKGGEINMKDEEKKIEEKIIKQEEVKPVEEKKEVPVVEEKKEEAPVVEEKKEEVVEKKADAQPKDGDECMMTDGKTKGHMKDGKCVMDEKKTDKVEKVEEKKEEVKAPEVVTVKVDASEFKEVLKEFSKEVSKVVETISKVEEKISKTVPAKEAAEEKKDAPKEVAKVEVAPKEEKVEKKSDVSSEGAILAKLDEIKKEFEDRIKKLEEQPAPSKVVFSKDFGGTSDAQGMTVEKINSRLDELKKIMNEDPTKYMKENMADEAIALVKEKKALAKK